MAHYLHLQIEDGTYNNHLILVNDLSQWDELLPVTNRILQILPPYAEKYITVPFPSNQTLALTSRNMDLSKKIEDLPDGVYKIHYSVAPNKKVFLECCHFRVGILMNKILSGMAILDIDLMSHMDSCGNIELNKQQNTLIHAWMLLKGAQAIGIDSYNIPKADKLYKQAARIYDKLFEKECKSC